MEIFIKNTENLGITSRITDDELIVLIQASERGLVRNAKVLVDFHGEPRYLDIEAIDRERTLPRVVFSGYTVPPPAPARTQAAELRKRPIGAFFLVRGEIGYAPTSDRYDVTSSAAPTGSVIERTCGVCFTAWTPRTIRRPASPNPFPTACPAWRPSSWMAAPGSASRVATRVKMPGIWLQFWGRQPGHSKLGFLFHLR
jgi:hypothetical protein